MLNLSDDILGALENGGKEKLHIFGNGISFASNNNINYSPSEKINQLEDLDDMQVDSKGDIMKAQFLYKSDKKDISPRNINKPKVMIIMNV